MPIMHEGGYEHTQIGDMPIMHGILHIHFIGVMPILHEELHKSGQHSNTGC